MSHHQLPERPNLDQLKRQAKDLLHAVRQHDAAALTRAHALPAFNSQPDDAVTSAFALHDAQSVVARELGFVSWNDLRENVESITLDFTAAVDEFIAAATGRRSDRAERVLEKHPRIARANFHTALLLGDAATVDSHLTRDPALATTLGGPRSWQPLHYVCFTAVGAAKPERESPTFFARAATVSSPSQGNSSLSAPTPISAFRGSITVYIAPCCGVP